jgi:hypothetical protein
MDRVLPSEGKGCWFDPSRAHHIKTNEIKPLAETLGAFFLAGMKNV